MERIDIYYIQSIVIAPKKTVPIDPTINPKPDSVVSSSIDSL
jgi:hypothetical protein